MSKVASAFYIKLTTPKWEISEALKLGTQVLFQGAGEVTNIISTDLHNGSTEETHIVKPKLLEVKQDGLHIEAPPLTTTGLPKGKSLSKEYRDKLYVYYQAQNLSQKMTFDEYYTQTMRRLIDSVDHGIDELSFGLDE